MPRKQTLMTQTLAKTLPKIGTTGNLEAKDIMVHAKFYNPYGVGTWYIIEFDGDDEIFCAVDLGMTETPELGYASLTELQDMPAYMLGRWYKDIQGIERDIHWVPCTLQSVFDKENT